MAAKHPSSSRPPDGVDAPEGDFMLAAAACAARNATRAAVCRPALPPRATLAAADAALRTEQKRAEQNRSASPAPVRARMLGRALAGTHLARWTAEPGSRPQEGVGELAPGGARMTRWGCRERDQQSAPNVTSRQSAYQSWRRTAAHRPAPIASTTAPLDTGVEEMMSKQCLRP